jgi:hypothetical protein
MGEGWKWANLVKMARGKNVGGVYMALAGVKTVFLRVFGDTS